MIQISVNYNSHMFLGDETNQSEFRGRPVEQNSWYIGDKSGKIESGPFKTESEVRFTFSMMIDTSGT